MSVSNLAFVYRTAQANLRQMLPDFRFHLNKKETESRNNLLS